MALVRTSLVGIDKDGARVFRIGRGFLCLLTAKVDEY